MPGSETDKRSLTAKGNLATVMQDQGQLAEARELYEAVLAARETLTLA